MEELKWFTFMPMKMISGIWYTPPALLSDLDGKKHKAVLQELQFHPVTDKLMHMDFVEVFDDKPVTVEIPIKLTGAAIGLKDGGKPRQRRRVRSSTRWMRRSSSPSRGAGRCWMGSSA